jgi:hypothetical protein
VLANMGVISPRDVAVGKYKEGLKVNEERRPLEPTPDWVKPDPENKGKKKEKNADEGAAEG